MKRDRMFHVLVLGGIALVGGACGSQVATPKGSKDAAVGDAGASDAPAEMDVGFPSELPAVLDSSFATDAGNASDGGADAFFPMEAP